MVEKNKCAKSVYYRFNPEECNTPGLNLPGLPHKNGSHTLRVGLKEESSIDQQLKEIGLSIASSEEVSSED